MHERERAGCHAVGDQLFDEWQIYEKLLIHDYMDHRAFFRRLQAEVEARFDRPVSILDLGCGDLAPIMPMLSSLPVQRYVGVDESEVALAIAGERLDELDQSYRLIQGDLLAALEDIAGPFDLILASFALHHLADPDDKRLTLERVARLLTPNGIFAMIDVFRGEDEPREDYLERWITNAERRYRALEAGEKTVLFDHVRARDFPLSLNSWQTIGREAGLSHFDVLHEDTDGLNRLVVFSA